MIIQAYKLNRKRERIGEKEIDLSRFERIGTTGSGFVLKYKKGKSIFIYDECVFDWWERMQEDNDRNVKDRAFSYKRINEDEPSSKQNTARDEKGRPIKVFVKPEDCFINVKNKFFVDKSTMGQIWDYAHSKNILCNWHEGRYVNEDYEPIK